MQILGRQPHAFFSCGLVAAILAVTTLAGCGQKGPLFIAPQSVPFKLGNNIGAGASNPVSVPVAAPQVGTPTPAASASE